MNQDKIRWQSLAFLFFGVAIIADLLPWPGLGSGFIVQTVKRVMPAEATLNHRVQQSQNAILVRSGNGG